MDVVYSGTVAAAREAALRGLRALAISADTEADMKRVASDSIPLAERLLALPQPGPLLLNVNFPRQAPHGAVATRLGRRDYHDHVEARTDPRGRSYYWIGGPLSVHEGAEGTDTTAVDTGYVSVTPLSLEMTSPSHFDEAALVAGSGKKGS
jgi:5'-nucleotidase